MTIAVRPGSRDASVSTGPPQRLLVGLRDVVFCCAGRPGSQEPIVRDGPSAAGCHGLNWSGATIGVGRRGWHVDHLWFSGPRCLCLVDLLFCFIWHVLLSKFIKPPKYVRYLANDRTNRVFFLGWMALPHMEPILFWFNCCDAKGDVFWVWYLVPVFIYCNRHVAACQASNGFA